MSLVENERIKLFANALNTACTSCFTVGIATPAAGFIYDVIGFRGRVDLGTMGLALAGWLATAITLHVFARRVLRGLKP